MLSACVGSLPDDSRFSLLPEWVAKGSRFTFGGLGVDTRSRAPASGVRNRPRTTVGGLKLPRLWEKSQKRVCLDVSEDVVMSFCVAMVAHGSFVTFGVCEEESVCATVDGLKLPRLWEKSQKRVCLDMSADVVMSFCVASVALCDIRRV